MFGYPINRRHSGSELYELIGEVERRYMQRGRSFFQFFTFRRRYTPAELAAAELLQWQPTSRFEPTGEECGTVYDESTTCAHCRVGRTQRSDLVLDLTRVPRRDVAISIGGEIVVSDRFRETVEAGGFTGMAFGPVRRHRPARSGTLRAVHQLLVTGTRAGVLSPPTQFGANPFDPDLDGDYRCPLGHVAGLNLLSEVTIDGATWSGADLVATHQHVGNPHGQGLLHPEPLLLVSPRLHQVIDLHQMTSGRFEVAHFGGV